MSKKYLVFGTFKNHITRKDGAKVFDVTKIISGVVSKLYKKDSGKILELLKDENATEETIVSGILEADVVRIDSLKQGNTYQDGFAAAKKQIRAAFEAELKTKYEIEEGSEGFDLEGADLVAHIAKMEAAKNAPAGGAKDVSKLTAEEIKALPGFKEIDKNFKKSLKDLETEWTGKLAAEQTTQQKATTFASFSEEALKELATLNPVIPGKAEVAQTRQKLFLKQFEAFDIRKEADGSFTFLKDGKAVQDAHGNLMDWKEVVKTEAGNHYEFTENNGGGNSGNNNNPDPLKAKQEGAKVGYPEGYVRPANKEEFAKVVRDSAIPLATRQAYSAAYEKENSATPGS